MNSIPVLFLFSYKIHSINTIYPCMSTVFVCFYLIWIYFGIFWFVESWLKIKFSLVHVTIYVFELFVFRKFWSLRLWLVGRVLGIIVSTTCAFFSFITISISVWSSQLLLLFSRFKLYYRPVHVWTRDVLLSKTRCGHNFEFVCKKSVVYRRLKVTLTSITKCMSNRMCILFTVYKLKLRWKQ